MNNLWFKGSLHRLVLRLAALILTGLGAVVFSSNAWAQPETRIISVDTNLNFGKTEIGSEKNFMVTIANEGNTDLTISNFNFPPGFNAFAGFRVELTNVIIAAGTHTNIFVTFAPTNVAHYGGTVTIVSDATSGLGQFKVSGDGAVAAGNYIGLFIPAANAAFENSGLFIGNVAGNGGFSGVLRLGGRRVPFSGRFSASEMFSGSITQGGESGLGASFQLFPGSWQGVISNDTWSATLFAFRVFHGPRVARQVYEWPPKKYQFHIAGSTNSLLAPTNDGVGTIRFTASRAVHLSGTLADGTPFSQDTFPGGGIQFPFYASLYQHQGAVLGWIDLQFVLTNFPPPPVITPITNLPPFTILPPFTNIMTVTNVPVLPPTGITVVPISILRGTPGPVGPPIFPGTNRISGSINWFKPAQIDANYPDGFSFQTMVNGPTR